MGSLSMLRVACLALAVALAGLGVAGALAGGEDEVAWGFFLSGLALWGLSGLAGVAARRAARPI